MQKNVDKRNLSYDVLRILAIVLVLYNHRESYLYFKLLEPMSIKYILTVFASVVCKCGPALFFMISGALLLEKRESFHKIFTHRILRMLIVMAAMAIVLLLQGRHGDSYIQIFSAQLCWYLYAYVAFLIMLPFLRILVQNMELSDAVLYFSITLIAYSLSGLLRPFSFSEEFTEKLMLFNSGWASSCWQLIFPMLGYWIFKAQSMPGGEKVRKRMFYTFLIGTVVSLVAALMLTNYDMSVNGGNNIEQILQRCNLMPACLLFYSITVLLGGKQMVSGFGNRLLRELSAATFGIFLIETHTGFSGKIFEYVLSAEPWIGRYMCSIVAIICELFLYFVIVFLLRRIPIVRKLL